MQASLELPGRRASGCGAYIAAGLVGSFRVHTDPRGPGESHNKSSRRAWQYESAPGQGFATDGCGRSGSPGATLQDAIASELDAEAGGAH